MVQAVSRVSQLRVGAASSAGRLSAPVPVTNDSTESDSRLSVWYFIVLLRVWDEDADDAGRAPPARPRQAQYAVRWHECLVAGSVPHSTYAVRQSQELPSVQAYPPTVPPSTSGTAPVWNDSTASASSRSLHRVRITSSRGQQL
jgi:hypothetical protein